MISMNEGAICNSFNECLKLLRDIGLSEEVNRFRPFSLSSSKFSQDFFDFSQKDDYVQIHKIAMENRDYDILLKDDSFFQFSCVFDSNFMKRNIRYAYYESPRDVGTYSEFLVAVDLSEAEDEWQQLSVESENKYEEPKEMILQEEYEQYKAESRLKKAVTPIRYDFHGEQFEELVHPISHIHIGFNNEVRIPLNRTMSPLDFTIFVLRNVYWKKWKYEIANNDIFKNNVLKAKRNTGILESKYFTNQESKLFYLT